MMRIHSSYGKLSTLLEYLLRQRVGGQSQNRQEDGGRCIHDDDRDATTTTTSTATRWNFMQAQREG
jgi:hypothetical protein